MSSPHQHVTITQVLKEWWNSTRRLKEPQPKPEGLTKLQGKQVETRPPSLWVRLFSAPLVPPNPLLVNLDHIRVLSMAGGLAGMCFGAYLGARTRRLQFLAENAHRLPKTVKGWFYYHRERNYQCMKAAGIEGGKQFVKFGAIMGFFAACETGIDLIRQKEDFLSTVGAGITTSIAFSLWSRLPRSSSRTAILSATFLSLVVGGLQDLYLKRYGESSKYPLPIYVHANNTDGASMVM